MAVFGQQLGTMVRLTVGFIFACAIFVCSPAMGQWEEQSTLTGDDAADGDRFGQSVAVSADTILIGSPWADTDVGSEAGAAYVFDYIGSNWNQAVKLTASDGGAFDQFGSAVCVRGDMAIISAKHDNDLGDSSGSAYIFERTGDSWGEIAKLTASDGGEFDQFGYAVSIYGDSAIVGTYRQPGVDVNANPGDPYYPYDPGTFDPGSAYIFERGVGDQWSQVANLSQGLPGEFDLFGQSVSIFEDKAIVGASAEGEYSGGAYVYERDAGGQWNLAASLAASDAAMFSEFGVSVSITGDTAVVGAREAGDSGGAYVFERDEFGVWNEAAILTPEGGDDFSNFGSSVSVSMDAIAIGAYNDDTARGSLHFYLRDDGGVWGEGERVTIDGGEPFDLAGVSVGVSGNTAVAGGPGVDGNGIDNGAAYVIKSATYLCIDGDVNCDGEVGLLDLDILGQHFGENGVTRSEGDLSLNGSVTLIDLDILGLYYGDKSTVVVIPEPGGLLLLTVVAGFSVGRTRR